MKFSVVAEYFSRIEATTLRNEKTEILADLINQLSAQEVAQVTYLSVGRLGPLYDPLEFGLAGKMVERAVAWGIASTAQLVGAEYKKIGDLGEVVEQLKDKLDNKEYLEQEISVVFLELVKIAKDIGKGSQERKVEKLGKLLRELDSKSAKYIVRLILGKIRLGFSDLTILDALSWARTKSKADRDKLERAFNVWSDMGEVARVYKELGVTGLDALDVVPGRPIKPMRAERLGTISEIVSKLERFAVEPKYDGMRVQIHAWNRDSNNESHVSTQQASMFEDEVSSVSVKIFSRGLEDITAMFPEVVESAKIIQAKIGDFVLDGEALGIDHETNTFLPFQETMKRKRKHNVGEMATEIPLSIQVFDVLFFDKKGVLQNSYIERRNSLQAIDFRDSVFSLAQSTIIDEEEQAQELFDEYMGEKLEGMLCKKLDSTYRAGARDFNWVKYKRVHEAGLVDTIDCVVMGYYAGKGKRQKFGVGAFLVGVLDSEKILTVAKIGTGLTDEQFRELFQRMKDLKVSEMPKEYEVPSMLYPDVWVDPKIIVEILADEITKSPSHTAGYALRFPRLVKFRDDKKLSEITTAEEVKSMFSI